MSLHSLPADQRPRERLLRSGAAALGDAELIALLLRTGLRGQSVVELAARVLAEVGGLAGLVAAQPQQLMAIKGLGQAKAAELAAVAEIARRALAQQLQQRPLFDQPQAAMDYAALQLQGQRDECFAVMFLDTQHHLIAWRQLFSGTLAHTSVHARVLVRAALELNAAAVIAVHNHPSGRCEASAQDVALTVRLREALALVDVRLLDHLIVGQGAVASLAQQGKM